MPDPAQDPQQKEQIKQAVKEVLEEQQGQKSTDASPEPSPEQQKMQKCIVDAANARNLCLQAMSYCLTRGGQFVDPKNYQKFQDSAELCDITAKLILQQSELKSDVAIMCSQACDEAVKVCDQFSQDPQMQACSQYLKICSESCKQI